jgi:hypothetical protein
MSTALDCVVKFDADFVERRLREHRELQERMMADAAIEIVNEVASALEFVQELHAGRGPAKIARLE